MPAVRQTEPINAILADGPCTAGNVTMANVLRRPSAVVECPAGKLAGLFMRFTIRDALWLTVVVGLGAAWFFDAVSLRMHDAMATENRLKSNATIADLMRAIEAKGYRWEPSTRELVEFPERSN